MLRSQLPWNTGQTLGSLQVAISGGVGASWAPHPHPQSVLAQVVWRSGPCAMAGPAQAAVSGTGDGVQWYPTVTHGQDSSLKLVEAATPRACFQAFLLWLLLEASVLGLGMRTWAQEGSCSL